VTATRSRARIRRRASQTAALLDLGEVPEGVAAAAGFDCLSAPAGLIDLTPDTTAPVAELG